MMRMITSLLTLRKMHEGIIVYSKLNTRNSHGRLGTFRIGTYLASLGWMSVDVSITERCLRRHSSLSHNIGCNNRDPLLEKMRNISCLFYSSYQIPITNERTRTRLSIQMQISQVVQLCLGFERKFRVLIFSRLNHGAFQSIESVCPIMTTTLLEVRSNFNNNLPY